MKGQIAMAATLLMAGCQGFDIDRPPPCAWFGNNACAAEDYRCALDKVRSSRWLIERATAAMAEAEQPDGSFNEWIFADPRRGTNVGPLPKLQDACDALRAAGRHLCDAAPANASRPEHEYALHGASVELKHAANICDVAIQLYADGDGAQGDANLRGVAASISAALNALDTMVLRSTSESELVDAAEPSALRPQREEANPTSRQDSDGQAVGQAPPTPTEEPRDDRKTYRFACGGELSDVRIRCPYTSVEMATLDRAKGACPPSRTWVCCTAGLALEHRRSCDPDCGSGDLRAFINDVAPRCGGSHVQEGGGTMAIDLWSSTVVRLGASRPG